MKTTTHCERSVKIDNNALDAVNAYTKVDLHAHSTCSDGTYSPQELVKKAASVGIEVFALTDHDTIAGIEVARKVASECGMRLVNGVEISCTHQLQGGYGKHKSLDKVIHVLALGFADEQGMSQALSAIQASRASRGKQMVEKLAVLTGHDFEVLWQAVLAHAGNVPEAVGRVHIAKVLVDLAIVPNIKKAFDHYLADNKPAYVAIESFDMKQTIELIHACKGKAVLAHPTNYGLSATRVRRLIEAFAQLGGDAIELPSASEAVSTRHMVDRCVKEHGLAVSVGSDFHGDNMPWRKLGHVPRLAQEQTLLNV